ncbi:MAG: hypothetical protein WBQ95_14935 [Terracidiphilus sp.]
MYFFPQVVESLAVSGSENISTRDLYVSHSGHRIFFANYASACLRFWVVHHWAWISDESSLWDFHIDETNERMWAKILEVYGVDVSDIESARLSEIFNRIAATGWSASGVSSG